NTYDSAGNHLRRDDQIYIDGTYESTQSVVHSYTCMDQVASTTRGSTNIRITRYSYHPSGQKATQTKADGSLLHYEYDALGYLQSLDSSDGQLSLHYTRDRLGRLLSAHDSHTGIFLKRTLDPRGRVLSEEWPSHLRVEKTYDLRGRLLSLTLPNLAHIE